MNSRKDGASVLRLLELCLILTKESVESNGLIPRPCPVQPWVAWEMNGEHEGIVARTWVLRTMLYCCKLDESRLVSFLCLGGTTKNLNAVTGCLEGSCALWSIVAGWLQAQTVLKMQSSQDCWRWGARAQCYNSDLQNVWLCTSFWPVFLLRQFIVCHSCRFSPCSKNMVTNTVFLAYYFEHFFCHFTGLPFAPHKGRTLIFAVRSS